MLLQARTKKAMRKWVHYRDASYTGRKESATRRRSYWGELCINTPIRHAHKLETGNCSIH